MNDFTVLQPQKMETAPKNQIILIWSGNNFYCAHWAKNLNTDDEGWVVAEFDNGGIDGNDQLIVRAPIAWWHLPAPPQD